MADCLASGARAVVEGGGGSLTSPAGPAGDPITSVRVEGRVPRSASVAQPLIARSHRTPCRNRHHRVRNIFRWQFRHGVSGAYPSASSRDRCNKQALLLVVCTAGGGRQGGGWVG